MGWQRREEKGAQEGRKLRWNIYADFISVWVPALESGKLMTLIPKLVCLELRTRPAPSPPWPAAPAPARPPPPARVGPGSGGDRGWGWGERRAGEGGEEAGAGAASRRDSSHLAGRDMKEATDATSGAEHPGSPAGRLLLQRSNPRGGDTELAPRSSTRPTPRGGLAPPHPHFQACPGRAPPAPWGLPAASGALAQAGLPAAGGGPGGRLVFWSWEQGGRWEGQGLVWAPGTCPQPGQMPCFREAGDTHHQVHCAPFSSGSRVAPPRSSGPRGHPQFPRAQQQIPRSQTVALAGEQAPPLLPLRRSRGVIQGICIMHGFQCGTTFR